jgi:hypothetical protein
MMLTTHFHLVLWSSTCTSPVCFHDVDKDNFMFFSMLIISETVHYVLQNARLCVRLMYIIKDNTSIVLFHFEC